MISWDKAYLINLEHEKERLSLSSSELIKWKIDFTLFPAIYDKNGKEGLKKTTIKLLSQAQKDNVTPLIIEDDVVIRSRFKYYRKYLRELERLYGDNWDVFYFYRDCRRQWKIKETRYLLFGPTLATHFYMINSKSIEKIIKIISNRRHSIDWDLLYAARSGVIKCYCTSSNLVCQDRNLLSSIREDKSKHTKRLGGILIDRQACQSK